ncbi:uncharacterized protein LOC108117183 [Drosophila eugracilis]|uniref:uncharacterized protein LOC108117183 n=1 Tax=Drosophila eugracilis TaxID=29029 RepID=UPI001BD9641D|nr:uncharacterized protein LOC108117183 [Drosophila eugracilis]
MAQVCMLCCSKEKDELAFGVTHYEDGMMVHRNCLYLSSNLIQRGNDRVGILRFLKEDIKAEAKRCKKLVCFYCHRPGANIGCCKSGCRRTFHTKCGFDNLAQNQFCDTYKSFCHQHVKYNSNRPAKNESCIICTERLIAKGERFNVVKMIYSPCCRNGWYHRKCLQEYANTAGYYFKCPLCNNKEVFHDVALKGISVPNQEASWETEPNAYAEQLRRESGCTAQECIVPQGRIDSSGNLLYCNNCGSNPSHIICTTYNSGTYVCNVCSIVSPIRVQQTDFDEEESDSDDTEPEQVNQANSVMGLNAVNNTHDLIHSKLYVSGWDDTDTEDDDDVFDRAVKPIGQTSADEQPSTSAAANRRSTRLMTAATRQMDETPAGSNTKPEGEVRANQENTDPTMRVVGSVSATNQLSVRSRRTMPARMNGQERDSKVETDKEQKERESRRRHLSPFLEPPNRRFLRSISPEVTPSRLNGQRTSATLRRRTMGTSRFPVRGNLDVSCVANRTRNRLPQYKEHRKDTE